MIFFLMPTGILHQCSGSVHGIPMTKSDGHLKTGTLAAKKKNFQGMKRPTMLFGSTQTFSIFFSCNPFRAKEAKHTILSKKAALLKEQFV
jgi:hypothetical protein